MEKVKISEERAILISQIATGKHGFQPQMKSSEGTYLFHLIASKLKPYQDAFEVSTKMPDELKGFYQELNSKRANKAVEEFAEIEKEAIENLDKKTQKALTEYKEMISNQVKKTRENEIEVDVRKIPVGELPNDAGLISIMIPFLDPSYKACCSCENE